MPPPYDWNEGRDGCIAGISRPFGFFDPKGDMWVITFQRGTCKYPLFHWECDTDVPQLLFAKVGIHPPWKKPGIHIKRGVVSHHDPDVYFPYRAIVCQNEKGMVTHHTFTWEVPGDDEVFWWACSGRSTGWFPKWSASISPFYNWKCKQPPPPTITTDCQSQDTEAPNLCQFWNANAQSFRPDHAYYARKLSLCLNQWHLLYKGPYIVKLTTAALPCYAEPILWSYRGKSEDLPDPGTKTWISFTLPYILLQPPTIYHIVVHTLPNWVKWDGSYWVDWESGATLAWRKGDRAHNYPRGDWLGDCNFMAKTGIWNPDVNVDFAFCLYE